jgi:diguanylate cyclase (GGDEF)-like protein/PAS domain S-box-containing protein
VKRRSNKNKSDKSIRSRILIIEDEMITAMDIKTILESRGYVTDIAASGKEALEKAEKKPPDLALLDIILKGGMSGIETARFLKKQFNIPIIFLTAFTSEEVLKKAKAIKPHAYIVKPFEENELCTNIEMALHTHQMKDTLEKSETRLKLMFDYAPDAYFLSDMQGKILDCNKALEKLIGYKKEELLDKDFNRLQIMSQNQIARRHTLLQKNIQGEKSGPEEFLITRKDKEQRKVEIQTFPMKISGKVCILGLARDITRQDNQQRSQEFLVREMSERIKELTCMYNTVNAIRESDTVEDMFRSLVIIIPSGWQYPEIARAKICYKYRIFRAIPFLETRWKQASPIMVDNNDQGYIEVYYTKKRPDMDEGPFTKEERRLLTNITKNVSEAIERRQLEKRITQLASLAEQNPNPIIEADIDGAISYMNQAARQCFPDIKDKDLDNPLFKDLGNVVTTIKKQKNKSLTREIEVRDSIYEEKICYFPDTELIRIFVFEVTGRKKTEQTLREIALIDPLTGLYNRRGFLAMVKQQIPWAKRNRKGLIIMYADIDNMKWINDNFGHQAGDVALTAVSNILHQTFRKSDIIARIGGDEFAVCAVEAKEDSEKIIIARLNERILSYNKKAQLDFTLSLSTGSIYHDAQQSMTIEELLDIADKRMYEQKIDHGEERLDAQKKQMKNKGQ